MSDKELSVDHAKQLDNIVHTYDNDVVAKAIFNLFGSVGWSNSLGLELLKLVHDHLFK